MIETLPRNILRFVFLVLLQVLVLNNIGLSNYAIPYVYILFILLLPFEIPGWLLLLLGFVLGLSVDIFTNTIGVHASATVFISFLRPYVLGFIAPRDGYESGSAPNPSYFGFLWFLKYALVLTVAHHAFLFFVEAFSFVGALETIGKTIGSTLFTIVLIMLSLLFMYKR